MTELVVSIFLAVFSAVHFLVFIHNKDLSLIMDGSIKLDKTFLCIMYIMFISHGMAYGMLIRNTLKYFNSM